MTIKVTFYADTVAEAREILSRVEGEVATEARVSGPIGPTPNSNVETVVSAPINLGDSETETEAPVKNSAAIRKLLTEYSLMPEDIQGTGKGGRITKANIVAHLEANTPPEAPAVDEFDFDDEAPEAPTFEIADVKTALIGYQTKLRQSLIDDGEEEDEARTQAMNTARKLLKTASGSTTLGSLEQGQYVAVIDGATTAAGELL